MWGEKTLRNLLFLINGGIAEVEARKTSVVSKTWTTLWPSLASLAQMLQRVSRENAGDILDKDNLLHGRFTPAHDNSGPSCAGFL